MPTQKLQKWTGKGTAYKIWRDINNYVDTYLSEHQHELESPWTKKWQELFLKRKIGEEEVGAQVAAVMITGDPLATIYDCIQTLFKLIPELKEHLVIQEIGKLNGNVRYFMEDYGFRTPAKTVPPPKEIPKQHSEPPPTTTFNRFEPFTDTSINDEPNIQDAREDPNNIIPPFKVETPMRYFTQHPSEWSESTWDSWTSADFPNGENKPSRRETLYEKACYHYNEFTSTLNAVSMSIDENEQQQQIQNSNSEPTNTSSNNIPPATEYKITDTSTNNSISTSINNENTVPTTETTNVNSTTEKKTVNAAL